MSDFVLRFRILALTHSINRKLSSAIVATRMRSISLLLTLDGIPGWSYFVNRFCFLKIYTVYNSATPSFSIATTT